jgi:hypothetical protein
MATQRKDKLKTSRKRKWRNNKNETTVDVVPSSIHIKMMGLDEVVDFGAEKKQRARTSAQAAKQKQKLHLPQGAASLEILDFHYEIAPFFQSNTACLEMEFVNHSRKKGKRKPRKNIFT